MAKTADFTDFKVKIRRFLCFFHKEQKQQYVNISKQ